MSNHNETSIHKEFELERLILFSDAVFAIAITLLIIEIKFPELPENIEGINLFKLFKHTIIQFGTFIISFIIIGLYWSRHLQLCRYLKAYDQRVIFHNLFFLFFVVTFPFTASGIGHFSPKFHIPMHIYFANFFFLTFSHYLLVKNTSLTIEGDDAEKKYLIMKSKIPAIMIGISLVIILTVYLLANNAESKYILYSYQSVSLFAIIMSIWVKKYKPKKKKNTIIAE
jgi:uncharacterized membrane protein